MKTSLIKKELLSKCETMSDLVKYEVKRKGAL